MPQWEYDKIDLSSAPLKVGDLGVLNEAGADGWELIGITANNTAYLKRQLGNVPSAQEQRSSAAPTRPKTPSSRSRNT